MNKSIKISIIVPVFNCEKYIEKCLKSLIYQTYPNLEIICIDDGSTDSSPEILKQFAQKDARIKILTQKNSGVSIARNYGIKEASGEYVSFIDADDWILLTLFEKFVNTISKVNSPIDIFMFNVGSYQKGVNDVVPFTFFSKNEWTNHSSDLSIHTFDDCLRPFSRNLSAANKIFRKNYLIENNILFPENLKYEDQYFFIKAALNAKTIMLTDEIFYRYRNYTKGSASSEITPKVFDIFKIIQMIEDEIICLNVYNDYKYALLQYKFLRYYQHYTFCPENLKEKYFNEAAAQLRKTLSTNIDINICSRLTNFAIVDRFLNKSWKDFDTLYQSQ